jgi:hypothetical protein
MMGHTSIVREIKFCTFGIPDELNSPYKESLLNQSLRRRNLSGLSSTIGIHAVFNFAPWKSPRINFCKISRCHIVKSFRGVSNPSTKKPLIVIFWRRLTIINAPYTDMNRRENRMPISCYYPSLFVVFDTDTVAERTSIGCRRPTGSPDLVIIWLVYTG